MNTVNLIGRLTQTPDLRYTTSGKAVANARLAVTRKFDREKADFINLIAWGKTAEILANNLQKGTQVGIMGRIETGSYEKDGRKVYTTEVIVEDITFVGSKGDGQQGDGRPQQQQQRPEDNDPFQPGGGPIEVSDDDLPF